MWNQSKEKGQEPHPLQEKHFQEDKPAAGLDQPAVWPAHGRSKPPKWRSTKKVDNPEQSTGVLETDLDRQAKNTGTSGHEEVEKSGYQPSSCLGEEERQKNQAGGPPLIEKRLEPLNPGWAMAQEKKSGHKMGSSGTFVGGDIPESQHTVSSTGDGGVGYDLHSQQARHWQAGVCQRQTEHSGMSLDAASVPSPNRHTYIHVQRDRNRETSGRELMRDGGEEEVEDSDRPAGLFSCFRGIGSMMRRGRVD